MMTYSYHIIGGDFGKAGYASSETKKILKQLNIDPTIIRRIAVAMYEAEVNIVAHAHHGQMNVHIDSSRVLLTFEDKGPGIEDIELAMQQGFSTASEQVREQGFGAGMGLPNIKKNSDELTIQSEVGKGTKVAITTYLK